MRRITSWETELTPGTLSTEDFLYRNGAGEVYRLRENALIGTRSMVCPRAPQPSFALPR